MKQKLTDAAIRTLRPSPAGRIEISDTERAGLRFRLTPLGKATWIYQKQVKGGVRRGFALGSYPAMTLSQARAAALAIQIDAERGRDPVKERAIQKRKADAEALAARTVEDILTIYIANHVDQELKPGAAREERKRQLNTYLKPHLKKRIDEFSRADIQRVVDNKQAEGKIVMANRLRAAILAFTHWAHKRGHTEKDVGAAVQRAGKETSRDRTPTLAEVREIWAATFDTGDIWGPFFRLCILTGQRSRSDVLQMKWSWIDFSKSRYEIPNPKNGRPHIVHLCGSAIAELRSIRDMQDDHSKVPHGKVSQFCPFVFSTTGITPSSGVSKAKARLDQAIKVNRRKIGRQDTLEPWVLHDLRRAQATALAEAGFDEGVVDRIQNHVAGGSRASAVAAVYNKAEKLPERARALESWADMVLGKWGEVILVRGGSGRVS